MTREEILTKATELVGRKPDLSHPHPETKPVPEVEYVWLGVSPEVCEAVNTALRPWQKPTAEGGLCEVMYSTSQQLSVYIFDVQQMPAAE